MQVSDVANPMINAAKKNREQMAMPTGQLAQNGTVVDATINKPAQAPADFKGTQGCAVNDPDSSSVAGDDAMMNAAELFPKKVDDVDGSTPSA